MVAIAKRIIVIRHDAIGGQALAAGDDFIPALEEFGYRCDCVEVSEALLLESLSKAGSLSAQDAFAAIFHFRHITGDAADALLAARTEFPGLAFIILADNLDDRTLGRLKGLKRVEYMAGPLRSAQLLIHALQRFTEIEALNASNEQRLNEVEKLDREFGKHLSALKRDQQAAQQIQHNLLPITPLALGDVTISHQLIPSLYLSGDFIDYGQLRKRFIPFYLVDVSGHGASSAFVTVWLKQAIRRYFENPQVFRRSKTLAGDLSALLSEINRQVMCSRFFCHLTCCIGVIDLRKNALHFALAGHLPLPVLLSDGKAVFLPGEGKPLGIFEDAQWSINSLSLPLASSLHIFSDGILEVLPSDDLSYKEEQLLRLVETTGGDVKKINEDLKLGTMSELPDDIAMLSIHGLSDPRHLTLASTVKTNLSGQVV